MTKTSPQTGRTAGGHSEASPRTEGQRLLVSAMVDRGLTVRDAAELAGVSKSAIGEYCRGVKRPTARARGLLQERLGVPSPAWGHVPQTSSVHVLGPTGEPPPVVPPSSLPELVVPHTSTVDEVKREVVGRLSSALRELGGWLATDPTPEDVEAPWRRDDGHPGADACDALDALVGGSVGREGWIARHNPPLAREVAQAVEEAARLFYCDDPSGPLEVVARLREAPK